MAAPDRRVEHIEHPPLPPGSMLFRTAESATTTYRLVKSAPATPRPEKAPPQREGRTTARRVLASLTLAALAVAYTITRTILGGHE